jgi:hypothetical protein
VSMQTNGQQKRPGASAGQFARNCFPRTLAARTGAAQQLSGPGARASVLSDGEVAESRDRRAAANIGALRTAAREPCGS